MRILIVEGDKEVCEQIQQILVKECFAVDLSYCGTDGLQWMLQNVHDLALVGRLWADPMADSIIEQARAKGIPTPILKFAIQDKGSPALVSADLYLTRPVSKRELLPPVWTQLRQTRPWNDNCKVRCGDLVLDTIKRELWHGSRSTTLTRRENTLMEFLLENEGAILSREQLFNQTWGTGSGVSETNLDNYIAYARKRLREVCSPLELVTVKAKGYCLRAAK